MEYRSNLGKYFTRLMKVETHDIVGHCYLPFCTYLVYLHHKDFRYAFILCRGHIHYEFISFLVFTSFFSYAAFISFFLSLALILFPVILFLSKYAGACSWWIFLSTSDEKNECSWKAYHILSCWSTFKKRVSPLPATILRC